MTIGTIIAILSTGGVSHLVGMLGGAVLNHGGWLGFGGKLATKIAGKRLEQRLARMKEKEGVVSFLDEAGAKRKTRA